MADTYVPPTGNRVALDFGGTYTPPAGNKVALEFVRGGAPVGDTQYLFPVGFDPAEVGAWSVRNQREYVVPVGFTATLYGAPVVWRFHTFSRPTGFAATGYGAARVILKDRPIYPAGINSLVSGSHGVINKNRWLFVAAIPPPPSQVPNGGNVQLRTRYVRPSGLNASLWGVSSVTHGVRRLQVNAGIYPPGFGAPWVSRSPREVAPSGVGVPPFAIHRVGGTRFLLPDGFDALRFGTRIIPEAQTVGGSGNGFVATLWGAAELRNQREFLRPASFGHGIPSQEPHRFGRPDAWNLRSYIHHESPEESGLAPLPWIGWTAIANRNRVIAAYGAVPGGIGSPLLYNNARLISFGGVDSTRWGANMVAHRVRPVAPGGLEAAVVSHWAAIYNSAKPLLPAGVPSAAFGVAAIENIRRYLPPLVGFDSSGVGVAFVDFRIRSISIEPRHGIGPPPIQLPGVKLHTRYADAIGYDASRYGLHFLQIHRNIVAPRWVYRGGFGEPRIKNWNPEAVTRGRDSAELGEPTVYLSRRTLAASGASMQAMGRPIIADSRRSLVAHGVHSLEVGHGLTVTKGGAPPYTPQRVEVIGEANFGVQLGYPLVVQRAIWPQGILSLRFGVTSMQSNGILVDPGISRGGHGRPRVELSRRRISLDQHGMSYPPQMGKPRLSPHTIWAVKEAPEQARANHGATGLHYVGETQEYWAGERFGRHRVGGRFEYVRSPNIGSTMRLGSPDVMNWRRVVEPKGILALRIGSVKVGDGREFLYQFASNDHAEFGRPSLTRPPYTGPQTVRPVGFAPPVGQHFVSHFHRSFLATGWSSMAMGASGSDRPYQWQRLHVGPPMPTIPDGLDASGYGEPWVSLWIRGVEPKGFDPFISEHTPEKFAERMRVRTTPRPRPAASAAHPTGFDGMAAGVPNVRPGVHYIRPDGNSDQHRKGAF